MGFSTDQIATARTFIKQAKTRPMSVHRQKEFAVNRTQSGTKLSRAEAEQLIESLFDAPEPEAAPKAAPGPTKKRMFDQAMEETGQAPSPETPAPAAEPEATPAKAKKKPAAKKAKGSKKR